MDARLRHDPPSMVLGCSHLIGLLTLAGKQTLMAVIARWSLAGGELYG
jgi:hypothetical protein